MPLLERGSKVAVLLSTLLILLFTLVVHPDLTWPLRAASGAALVAGWFVAAPHKSLIPFWILVGTLAPAFLRLLAGREGPVLDLVWMAGLTGSLVRTASWSRWTLPAPWNLLIGGWALGMSLAWPVFVGREVDFRVAGLYDAGAINSWGLMTAPQVVTWILHVVHAQILGALWLEWAGGALTDPDRKPSIVYALTIGTTLASLVAIVQGTISLELLSTEFWASERRTTGTMLDANSYGLCAALAAPLAFLAARRLMPGAPAVALGVFIVNWAGMWLSGSRTAALLCGTAGLTGLVIGLWRERRSSWSRAAMAIALSGAAIVVLVGLMAGGTASPIQRALDIPGGRAGLAALWNRGGYGPIALRMTREYPLTGVGAGSYRVLAPDYWREMANDTLPLDNAQNWWRHQIAELGVFGGAFIIAFSVLVGWRVLTARTRRDDAATAWTLRGLLIGLGATSLLGMPTQTPLVLFWFFALVAWFITSTLDGGTQPAIGLTRTRSAWTVAWAFAIVYASGHLLLAAGSLGVVERAQRGHRDYAMGTYPPEPLPGSGEFRWTRQDARFFWSAKTRWLVIRLWAHHPDIGVRPVHVSVTTPCGVLFDEPLTTPAPMSLGITLPEGQETLEARVHVSRTWKPSDTGDGDTRELGVGVVADFVTDPALAVSQFKVIKTSPCGAGI